MCKAIINRVDLGKRVVGYELYSYDSEEILGLTVSQIKALVDSGEKVLGVRFEGKELLLDGVHTRNIMVKTGIGNFRPLVPDESLAATIIYTVLAFDAKQGLYETINSRFGKRWVSEESLRICSGFTCVNGITFEDGKVKLCEGVKVMGAKQEAPKGKQ